MKIPHHTYDLSVIIVNYNVEYFLDQCLDAVHRASKHLSVEVFVVDNNSVDGSMAMVKEKYPWVKTILNKDNVGFSKANNQAIEESDGRYTLLLNPDTVVEEDTFDKVVHYMDNHLDVGGLGVRMLDGTGKFLPESKRGLPTPAVAFYKIFGLSKLFPESKRFGQYHLGHISEHETADVDVLSGAFMLLRKSVLDKVGLLDETFFMYGEDIDLSYRIKKEGYKNVYFSDTNIIHYKGESTKKSSANYVFVFYRAMIIFAKKHFSENNAWLFTALINVAIYLRAFLALLVRFIKSITLPAVDFLYITFGLFALTNYWSKVNIEFPFELIKYAIPIYSLIWIGLTYFQGGYDRPVKLFKYVKGIVAGTLIILLIYALLPKSLQFSRLFILTGALWGLLYYFVSRVFLHFAIGKKFDLKRHTNSKFIIVSEPGEFERIQRLLGQTNENLEEVVNIPSINANIEWDNYDEVVFSSGDLAYSSIIEAMDRLKSKRISFKIAPPESDYLIGSDSIDTVGELYIINVNTLVSDENKRKKRFFDFCTSLFLLLLSPVLVWMYKDKVQFFKNMFQVFIGKKSIIGFSDEIRMKDIRLPKIKSGILNPSDVLLEPEESVVEKLNLLYSRDYSMRKDFSIILKAWRNLDR